MSVRRVLVVRSGGFAGVERRAEEDDPGRAERLAEAVRASAARDADGRARDAFVYAFTLITTASDEVRVDLPEHAMDGDLRALVGALFG